VYISSRKAEGSVTALMAKELSEIGSYFPTGRPLNRVDVSVSRTRFWRAKTISTSW